MNDAPLYPVAKPGRCANGAQRDRGAVVHAIGDGSGLASVSMVPALCGTRPGRLSAGWQRAAGPVTCPRCLKRAAAQTVTHV